MREAELVIVGGGPAGLSAAIEAARHGLDVVVVDENSRPGGQIYRAMPTSFQVRDAAALGKDFRDGDALRRAFDALPDTVTLMNDTLVWGAFRNRELALLRGDTASRLRAGALILAPGCYERPVPFPGWTLPGVYGLGGLQQFVKTERILPAKRVLLAGTGPLLWVVGAQLLQAGIEVVAVLDSASYRSAWRHIPALLSNWKLLNEARHYLRLLRRAGVPVLQRHAIFAARGEEGVTACEYGPVDAEGRATGKRHVVEVDTLGVGYGFVSSVQLARLCGCEHRYVTEQGGWVPTTDAWQATSAENVYAAGDGAGVAGVVVARAEGRLAALGACHALGYLSAEAAEKHARPLRRSLSRLRRFRTAADAMFRTPPGLVDLIEDDTVVCRCEEVLCHEIRALIAAGAEDVNEVKKLGRPGMGPCQARMCEASLRAMMSAATGKSPGECGALTVRPPIKPVPLQSIAAGCAAFATD